MAKSGMDFFRHGNEMKERSLRSIEGLVESGFIDESGQLTYDAKLTDSFKLSLLGYKQNTVRLSPGMPETKFKDIKKGINFKGNYSLQNGNIVFGYNFIN